jgi:hypothetical protein
MSANRPRVTHETRARRDRREFLKRAFVWVFIFVFVFSVAGGLIVFAVR